MIGHSANEAGQVVAAVHGVGVGQNQRRRIRCMHRQGTGVNVNDPDGLAAGSQIFADLLRDLGWRVALGQNFDGQVRRAIVKHSCHVRPTQPGIGNKGNVGHPRRSRRIGSSDESSIASIYFSKPTGARVTQHMMAHQHNRFLMFLGCNHQLNKDSFHQLVAGMLGQRSVFLQRNRRCGGHYVLHGHD